MNRTCTAKRTDGQPCKAPAIKGGTVCRVHGGSAPQVKAAARRRLEELLDPALVRLRDILIESHDERVVMTAIREVLTRCGIEPPIPIPEITMEVVGAEIERLESELKAQGKWPLPKQDHPQDAPNDTHHA